MSREVKITWLWDTSNCETCGSSWAEGAHVTIDGKDFGNFDPLAVCYDGASYSREEVYQAIIKELGVELSETTQEQGDDE